MYHFYSYKYSLIGIVIAANILSFSIFYQSFFDENKAKYANQYSNSIIQDIGGEVPQALIGGGILVGESDGYGEVDEMGEHLRDALLRCIEHPDLPRSRRALPKPLDQQDGEREHSEPDLDQNPQHAHHVAVVVAPAGNNLALLIHFIFQMIKVPSNRHAATANGGNGRNDINNQRSMYLSNSSSANSSHSSTFTAVWECRSWH